MKTLIRDVCRRARAIPLADRVVQKFIRAWFHAPSEHDVALDDIFQRRYAFPFPPTHYYSPLPDIAAVKRNLRRWYKQSETPGMDWNLPGQLKLASELERFVTEAQSLPPFSKVTAGGFGPGYGEVEAYLLYMMLRHFKPARFIEVGSGVSTFYALTALRVNQEKDGIASKVTCIEPYPNDTLRELAHSNAVDLQDREVQDVELATFQALSANDVLFIDSSHVSKKDSDVDFLYLEVLPRLGRGVIVHIHDIPLPMPGIPLEHSLFDMTLFWNETALVKAFLMFNSAFQVIQCQSQLHYVKPEVVKRLAPVYDSKTHFPASLWLRRIA